MKKLLVVLLVVLCAFPYADVRAEVQVSAKSAVVINAATGNILFQKNANEKLPMASTTKIMTALILAEQPDLTKTIVTTAEMVTVEGSSMGLLPGDTVSFYALLCGMLLASGNDAANTTAIVLSGSIEKFAELMNQKAKEIGMLNTNFVTPSGLDDENHYSTAYDMALLAKYALNNEKFAEVAASVSKTVSYGNPPYKRTLTNHNKLLKIYDGAVGVKTGFTKKSGRCLVSAAERDSGRIIAVTLNAPDDWDDHTNMLNFGFSLLEPLKGGELELKVVGSTVDTVKVCYDAPEVALTQQEFADIKTTFFMPRFVYGKVEKGSTVGRYTIQCGGNIICEGELKALEGCEMGIYNSVSNYEFFKVLERLFLFNKDYKR